MITTDVNLAAEALQRDELVAMPTETVYGLAGNALSEHAVGKIFALKQRPLFNPLIVHVGGVDDLSQIAQEVPDAARRLADAFWPGPLTLVLKKRPCVPDVTTAGKDTVAVRIPDHPVALELLAQLDFPLAAPSANPFGSISPTTAEHVDGYFGEQLPVILDGGPCRKGIESTIIGFEGEQPIVYRLGALAIEDVERVVGPLASKTQNDNAPEAPGMLSRHYAPRTETRLTDEVEEELARLSGKKIGLLLFQKPSPSVSAEYQELLSPAGDLAEAARNLYAAMHRLDQLDLDLILAEKLPDEGLGKTLNDKLRRACCRD